MKDDAYYAVCETKSLDENYKYLKWFFGKGAFKYYISMFSQILDPPPPPEMLMLHRQYKHFWSDPPPPTPPKRAYIILERSPIQKTVGPLLCTYFVPNFRYSRYIH